MIHLYNIFITLAYCIIYVSFHLTSSRIKLCLIQQNIIYSRSLTNSPSMWHLPRASGVLILCLLYSPVDAFWSHLYKPVFQPPKEPFKFSVGLVNKIGNFGTKKTEIDLHYPFFGPEETIPLYFYTYGPFSPRILKLMRTITLQSAFAADNRTNTDSAD